MAQTKTKEKVSKEDIIKIEKRIRREEFIEEGAYDGRLSPKIHEDKKKKENKRKCREKVKEEELE